MSKKLTWEVDKTSLVLKVTDGAKETTWKIRKNQGTTVWIKIFSEVLGSFGDLEPFPWEPIEPTVPMLETARTVDAEELAELQAMQLTEAGSREALNARVGQLSQNARWWDDDDEESAFVAGLPDYDTGEI